MTLARPRLAPAPLTVTQLTALLREALDREVGRVLVAGEISNLRAASSGHVYFTLKDDGSQIRCVMFKTAADLLVFTPADGQDVIVRGKVSLYPARGDLQLYVDRLEPQGRGALQLAFEQLKERLAAEGLFDEARKRPLPFFPRHIGVVTALGGAALRDIMVILKARCAGLHVVIRPALVQGPTAGADLANAIAELNAHPELEVLIVGRGGGSLEDLWPFNEERLARAIAASRLPVISAVGHEVDFTIADLVADRRAPTPTAAAEMVVPRAVDLAARLERAALALRAAMTRRSASEGRRASGLAARLRDPRRRIVELRADACTLGTRLNAAMRRRCEAATALLAAHDHRLGLQHPAARLASVARAAAAGRHRLDLAIGHVLADARDRIGLAAGALDNLSPLAVLQRGYSLTRRVPEGTIVRDGTSLTPGDRVEITFAVGRARARIEGRSRKRRS